MSMYKIIIISPDDEQSYEVTAPDQRAALLTLAAEPVPRDVLPVLDDALPTDDAMLLGLGW